MRWHDLVPYLEPALARFERPIDPALYSDLSGPALVEHLFDLDTSTRPALDKAIRQFADKGDWPELSPEEQLMIAMRISCASDLLNILVLPDPNKPSLTAPESQSLQRMLIWLLTDTWDWRADHWLKCRAIQLAWGGNFYR